MYLCVRGWYVCVCIRLRGWVEGVGVYLLAEEDSSLMQQVSAISNIEESIYLEASEQPLVPPDR